MKAPVVGELSYANTAPFRLGAPWRVSPCPSPRWLAQWAAAGRVDAGVLPVVEAWRLEKEFEPVGDLGIAAHGPARSVLLFSRVPWAALGGHPIGVTDHTSTSVRLLELLLAENGGAAPRLRRGFREDDSARLVIGDAALAPDPLLARAFPQVTDLAQQWRERHGASFVFARWMVRRTVPDEWKRDLWDALEDALTRFDEGREGVVRREAARLGLPPDRLDLYYRGLIYRLTEREHHGETLFKNRLLHPQGVPS